MNKMSLIVSMILAIISCSLVSPDINANEANSGPQLSARVYILPRSNISTATVWDNIKLMKDAEFDLMEKLKNGLFARGLLVNIIDTGQSLPEDMTSNLLYMLIVRLEEVRLGFRGPFGRISTVRASFTFQKSNGAEVFSRRYEETSHRKWKNSTRKISELVVADVADAILNIPSDRSNSSKSDIMLDRSNARPEGGSIDERLQQLDDLRAKGLITPEEYKAKRKEVLNKL